MVEQRMDCDCQDAVGRPGTATVILRDGRELVVIAPAGGSAIWGPGQVDQAERLQRALAAGIRALRRQHRQARS